MSENIMLRPVRLKRFEDGPGDGSTETNTKGKETSVESKEALKEGKKPSSGVLRSITNTLGPITPVLPDVHVPPGEEGAHHLLKRTPSNYIINQIYGLWVYLSLFLLSILIARNVSTEDAGVYAVAATAFNTIAYIVAFGLEDATTTFVPRVISEYGRASAAQLIRRLLGIRVLILGATLLILLFCLPFLANFFALIPTPIGANIATGLRSPDVQQHIAPIAFWVLANGIFSLLNAVYAALMRMKVVFIVGGLVQLFLIGLCFVTLRLGWGITSILWLQGGVTFVGAVAFALWLTPLLFTRDEEAYHQSLTPIFKLGFSAWFTNLVSGALLKQIAIIFLLSYGISRVEQAYFNYSFQLTDGANLLLVSGFGGVGVAALSAAFVGFNYGRLSRIWQTLLKIETLLAAPGLVFCLFNAQHIMIALYGEAYAPAGRYFAIFLVLNLIVRLMGMTVHQSTLYVLGRNRSVVIAQWLGLATVIGLGFLLVPQYGVAGALIADGVARIITCGIMLLTLWNALPEKYPLGYTLRVLLATMLAAIPVYIFHPSSKPLLLIFGLLFLILSTGLLMVIRPLSRKDLNMIAEVRPGVVRYLKWFARAA